VSDGVYQLVNLVAGMKCLSYGMSKRTQSFASNVAKIRIGDALSWQSTGYHTDHAPVKKQSKLQGGCLDPGGGGEEAAQWAQLWQEVAAMYQHCS
jgi:hypothetical protein